jgi:hypothetical protein
MAKQRKMAKPITDQKSFEELCIDHEIAGIFFLWALDCLNDLAYWVAKDFFRSPHLYTQVGVSTSTQLGRLRARYGSEVEFPDQTQRQAIYAPLFGDSGTTAQGEQSSFRIYLGQMIQAASAFAEKTLDIGAPSVRQRVRDAAEDLQNELATTAGSSVVFSFKEVLGEFATKTVYPILTNNGVDARFGIPRVGSDYPFKRDASAEKLVEELSKASDPSSYITRQEISNAQRVAVSGAEAIAATIDFDPRAALDKDVEEHNPDVDEFATQWYRFGTAWKELQGQAMMTRQAASQPAVAPIARQYPLRSVTG